ncbi:MAG TPA: hypothetical protein VJ302_25440 [Blastocatellia bacterium]|nr:hypothetical protein [Blastocatellia bacterium]
MKKRRYSYLFLLGLLVCFIRTEGAAQVAPPIRTERETYEVKYTRNSVKLTIKTSYTNRTGDTVYLSKCRVPSEPILQKRVRGRWILAYERPQLLCREKPVRIKPGETYKDRFQMEAFLPGNNNFPKFEVREVPGTYRLVRSFHRGSDEGPLLPLRERVSNQFQLVGE